MTYLATTWSGLGGPALAASLSVPMLAHLLAAVAAIFCTLWILLRILGWALGLAKGLRQKSVMLEVTPPKATALAHGTTAELFGLLSGLIAQRQWSDRLALRGGSYSLEIWSRKGSGIRYGLRVPVRARDAVERSLKSYSPGIQVREIPDYLPENLPVGSVARTTEFRQARHFALPLGEQPDLRTHDPLAYLTGSMTGLEEGELLAFQVVLGPAGLGIRKESARLRNAAKSGSLEKFPPQAGVFRALENVGIAVEAVLKIAMLPLMAVADALTGQRSSVPDRTKPAPTPSQLEAAALVSSKLEGPLFEASVRALVIARKDRASVLGQGLRSSFSSYLHASGQGLCPALGPSSRYRYWKLRNRIGSPTCALSAGEAGSLWHFPFASDTQSQDMVRVRSRELPVPLSLKRPDAGLDVVLGMSAYGAEKVPLGITLEQRRKHLYVIGKTGTGKTTMLTKAIWQDMASGKGLAVLDPHGDMLRELLQIVPPERMKDVILFDPSDREFPIGLNILAPGIDFESKEDADEWITGAVISVFAKLTAKEHWGPRMEHILRSATLTALQTRDPSLYTLQRLLTDRKYQKKVSSSLKDPVLRQFWQKEFALLGDMQLSSAVAPLTQRIGHFITSRMSRHILLQEKSTVSISDIMNEGKILLVNLSKGDLGEDQSFFFGTVLTSLIWMAAYQRVRIPEDRRRDFFLYVDEFQNFATQRFAEITSEGRKFRISLTASHQNVAQVEDPSILKVVAGNAGTVVCLKASPDDERFVLPFMEPEVEKGDIVNLPPYRFYMKVTNAQSEQAFSGETAPLGVAGSEAVRDEVTATSREKYGVPRSDVEAYLDGRLGGTPKAETEPEMNEDRTVAARERGLNAANILEL